MFGLENKFIASSSFAPTSSASGLRERELERAIADLQIQVKCDV
jgi:hypothetical protein